MVCVLRPLENKPINIHIDLEIARHIIDGDVYSAKPEGVRIWGENLQ